MDVEARLKELNLTLPPAARPVAVIFNARRISFSNRRFSTALRNCWNRFSAPGGVMRGRPWGFVRFL